MSFLALCALVASPANAEVVDRVVAVVESRPVLASEIRLEDALAHIDPSDLPFWREPAAGRLAQLVDAAVIRYVAADITLYQPDRESVTARLDAVRIGFPDRARWNQFLAEHGLDEARLETILRRRMVVERYLQRNVAASPSDAAAWTAECETLLVRLRPRVRLREIPLRGAL